MSDWIDTHCHLDAAEFAGDASAVRERARRAGVALCVLPAVDRESFQSVRQLAHEHGDAYALGIHPLRTPQASEGDLAALERELDARQGDARLVAVGEIGLDHFVAGLDRERQAFFYREQLRLARRFDLPVILHVRRSADALLRELRRTPVSGGIAHAFNGSLQQAQAFVGLGLRLGFGGTLTYDRALQIRRLAEQLPLEALVVETDAPDIPPRWLYRTAAERGAGGAQGRNEPGELPAIGAALAALRGMEPRELARATRDNALAALPRLGALVRSGPPGVAIIAPS